MGHRPLTVFASVNQTSTATMLRLAAFVVLSFAALGICEEEPAADKPQMQGDLQGDWYDQGLCRQVSCASGFRCVPQGYNAPSIGIGGNGRVMCIRWDTSCRDLVDNGMDYGMGPGNQYPGMGPGAGNQCNSDADCYRLSNAGNNIGNGMGYDRASMGETKKDQFCLKKKEGSTQLWQE